MKTTSLRGALNRAILLASVATVVVAAVYSATSAWFEARENQDELLRSVTALVQASRLLDSGAIDDDVSDESLVVRTLDRGVDGPLARRLRTLDPGLHTLRLDDDAWRVSLDTHPRGDRRFVVAQQTAVRDELALSIALHAFVPAVLLAALVLLVIDRVVRRRFARLDALTASLEDDVAAGLDRPLPETDVPDEIRPFLAVIRRLRERDADTLERQRRFVADAAHELRTPVAALALQGDNLRAASAPAERDARLGELRRGVNRLQRLIEQLLDLARLQGAAPGATSVVNAGSVVREVISGLVVLAAERDVDLGATDTAGARVHDETDGLARLLRNAIENAVRHTPAGGRVDVGLTIDTGEVCFAVVDDGPGIAPAELERVFEPFRRGTAAADAVAGGGTGLGLGICREIARRLGGRIRLANVPPRGLRFEYRQPVAPEGAGDAGPATTAASSTLPLPPRPEHRRDHDSR